MLMDPTRYWPSAANTLLLTAALHPDPDKARQGWLAWEELQRIETANWAEMRVFPVVARRLPELGIDSPLLPRLAGVRRFLWTKSRMLHRAVTPPLESLRAAGITPVLTKGAARVALDPDETVERYSHDVDVLVRPDEWEAAVDLVLAAGLAPKQNLTREALLRLRQRFHALGFRKAEALIDLHLFAMKRNRCQGDDDGLRERSIEARFVGVPVRVPCAEDRMVMALGHGLLFNPGRVTDWAFDAVAALRTPGFDWELVRRELIRRGLAAFGVCALRYLRHQLGQPVPAELIEELERDVSPVFAEELEILHHDFFSRVAREHAVLNFADLERAHRSAAALPPAPAPVARVTDWTEATILPPTRSMAERVEVPAPGWAGRAERLVLEVAFRIEALPPRGVRLMLELICFEAHETCLHQRFAQVVDGRAVAAFGISGEFLVMRGPARFQMRAWHLSPDEGRRTVAVPSARFRWRSN